MGTSTARACAELSRVENDDAVGATAELAKRKRDAALGLCGEPLLGTGGNDAMSEWRRGFAAGGECLDVQRPGVAFGADLAVQLGSLRFQDLGDLNERCPARVGKIEGQQSPIVLALASHGAPNRALWSNEKPDRRPARPTRAARMTRLTA